MNQLNAFGMQDIWIIWVSLCIGILFAMFFADKLFKFYLGIIVWFLLFIAFNCQIDVLENLYGRELTWFQDFLVKNKQGILRTLSILIPILWVLFALNPFKKWSFLPSLILGSMMPPFLLWVLWYVMNNSLVDLPILESILSLLDNSFLLDFLKHNSQYIFLALLFLLFYKYIFALLWAFLLWLFYTIWGAFFGEWNRRWDDEEEYEDEDGEEEYEDEDEDEGH